MPQELLVAVAPLTHLERRLTEYDRKRFGGCMITPTTPWAKEMARKILRRESNDRHEATIRACNKLRVHLGSLVGTAGFRELLHRALILSRPGHTALETAVVQEDGALICLERTTTATRIKSDGDAGEALVGKLLSLLELFLGEALTLHLIQEIWPILKAQSHASKIPKS